MSNYHCRCGNKEGDCAYPKCHNGQYDRQKQGTSTPKEQAFREWMAAANNHCYCSEDVWNAACDWQKAQNGQEIKDLKYKLEINRKIVALYEED